MDNSALDRDTAYTMQYLQRIKEMYWTQKLGYYPTKMEKVVRVISREQADKEKELSNAEFEVFLKSIK